MSSRAVVPGRVLMSVLLVAAGCGQGAPTRGEGTGGRTSGCAAGHTDCSGTCVSLTGDPAHCGACDHACATGMACVTGVCTCQGELVLCGAECVNLQGDGDHCGACGHACSPGQVCSAGSCGDTCPTSLVACGTSCVDLLTNAAHCGGCGVSCAPGQTCQSGACACPLGESPCGTSCVDTNTSPLHCGACGVACAAGQSCVNGACGGGGAGGTGGASGGASTGGTPSGGGTLPSGGVVGAGGTGGGVATGGTPSGGGTLPSGGAAGAGGTGGAPDEEEYPLPDSLPDEDGSQLWLRYPLVPVAGRLAEYRAAITHVVDAGDSPTLTIAEDELVRGLGGLTGRALPRSATLQGAGGVVLGTPSSSPLVAALPLAARLAPLGAAGYLVEATEVQGQRAIVVAANTELGVLYGSFALLRHLQCHRSVAGLTLSSAPRIERRILNHWDNLDRTVERGYAGRSLWDWSALPGTLSPRYVDYARANASLGINGAVLTNVNANAQVLTAAYLDKVAALADVFRPYGIAVYLTARFSAPIEIGGLSTADPANSSVQQWWRAKASEIYDRIPDFGGFLVKANSEGQPGPQDYGRSHADGANLLAGAVGPHGGIVLWRAFVYSDASPVDRIRQAYDEFKPLDGHFADRVLVQVKNGPLDFQPREPFSPLFGAMPRTPLALELQITKEYLGQDTHLAYLGPLYEEVLQADTEVNGAGSTVARVIDGSLHGHTTSAISGVANVGTDTNWTGSHFNQANWYVYGRMAWDPDVSAEAIAEDWVRQTLTNDPAVVAPVTEMLMSSREAVVNYMTPLGLAHIMASNHHYGPGPWVDDLSRPEWNPVYYHRADSQGLGFDRTAAGSNAVAQYAPAVRDRLASRGSIPDELLLFFHHVGWQETMSSGRTLWEELVYRYSLGVDQVADLRESWRTVAGRVDARRFEEIDQYLEIQHYEARWWRDACLQYFRTFAGLEVPSGYASPAHALSFYQGLTCPSDVTRPRCDPVYTGSPSPAILP